MAEHGLQPAASHRVLPRQPWRPVTETTLRYDAPASAWTEALPLGNGRIGAMVFGGVAVERLQL
ncbi:hypothetical protein HP550_00050, partial [Cellulomonas humilata]|nr:hypothetical protein [Cellulomonas humilata]